MADTDSMKEESKMSRGMDNPFPGLGSASCENVEYSEINKEYSSGARYVGQVKDNKKTGRGMFIWPNGAKYEGEFVDNVRNGQGLQSWPDGSSYKGTFSQDMRHGQGKHCWANGESYEGIFYRDHRHGTGRYTWSDGSSYSGTFYMDYKEGYGCFCFADGRKFQGLYKRDEREGPGIMTYPDGRQDVGLWHRDNLARLCSHVDGAFTMKDHPEFDYFPDEHRVYITPESIANRHDIIDDVIHPPEQFNYQQTDVSSKVSQVFQGDLHDSSVAMDIKSYHDQFNKSVQGSGRLTASRDGTDPRVTTAGSETKSSAETVTSRPTSAASKSRNSSGRSGRSKTGKQTANSVQKVSQSNTSRDQRSDNVTGSDVGILAWNSTPSSIEMQKHIIHHSMSQGKAGFNVDDVINGTREGFGEKGPLEIAAERFLESAAQGNVKEVAKLLHEGKVYVDVADRSGHTALLAAAVNWHQDVINCLLDNGSDVNKLNNEGVSALAACHIFFYPTERFRYNIAERYLEKPSGFSSEPNYDVADAARGILNVIQKKKPHPPPEKKQQSVVDSKHIQKLRDEYTTTAATTTNPEKNKEDPVAEEAKIENPKSSDSEREDSGTRRSPESRKLGTLKIKRTVRINIDEMLDLGPVPETNISVSNYNSESDGNDSDVDDFESYKTAHSYRIEVVDQLIDRCATALSTNEMVVGRSRISTADLKTLGTARRLAMEKAHQQLMESTIRLLLRRGADPNASDVPMPVLFFAVKAADVDAVKTLLTKGASTSTTLSAKKGGLTPLHIAAAIPGEEGVQITALLLDALADPDARASEDDSFLNRNLQDEWIKDSISEESKKILGGRTPLHIACARDDNYKNACSVVHLLLDHHSNPNLLCNGHSPLALAIRSGNDLAVDVLLAYNADPCLPLTHGVGSALCIASSTEYEHRRSPDGRINLIDKLIAAGADILAPITIGPKRLIGTAVDYAYHLYNLDRRIAHMPYHALTPAERETFNARRRLLAHLGDIIRQKATEKERQRLEEEERLGRRSRSPSPNFVYTGAGAAVRQSIMKQTKASDSKVSFSTQDDVRKPLFKYCYECGRSVGVRLAACTRCKEVFYCSKACKVKAWNARHKDECIRLKGSSPVMSKNDKRIDSPTPATDADKGRQGNVNDPRVKDTDVENPASTKYHSDPVQSIYSGVNDSYENGLNNDDENFGSRQDINSTTDIRLVNGVSTDEKTHSKNKIRSKSTHDENVKRHQPKRTNMHSNESRGDIIKNKKSTEANRVGKHISQPKSQVPFKGRSISASNKPKGTQSLTVVLPNGKMISASVVCKSSGQGPCTMILPNGKLIYVDNYSFV